MFGATACTSASCTMRIGSDAAQIGSGASQRTAVRATVRREKLKAFDVEALIA